MSDPDRMAKDEDGTIRAAKQKVREAITDIVSVSALSDWKTGLAPISNTTVARSIEPVYVVLSSDGRKFNAKANVHVLLNYEVEGRSDPISMSDTISANFLGTVDAQGVAKVEHARFRTEDFHVLKPAE